MKQRWQVMLFVCVALRMADAAPVIPDYQFKMVGDKPGVIPVGAQNTSSHLGLSNPNPADTGAGAGHRYVTVGGQNSNYSEFLLIVHRNDVTAYNDFQGKNSVVAQFNAGNNLTPKDDGRIGSVTGGIQRTFYPIGRMTHEGYWINATGGSDGPYYEWQPRDAREGGSFNTFLVYPMPMPAPTE